MAMREWTRPRPMAGCHFEDRRNSRPSRNPAIAKPTKAMISPIEPRTLRSTPIAGFRRRPTLAPYRHDRTPTSVQAFVIVRSCRYEGAKWGRTEPGSTEQSRERGGGRWHRSEPLEVAEYVAAQSVCGGRDVQEALAQEAEVPRLHQLRAEASVDSIPAPPNVYKRSRSYSLQLGP